MASRCVANQFKSLALAAALARSQGLARAVGAKRFGRITLSIYQTFQLITRYCTYVTYQDIRDRRRGRLGAWIASRNEAYENTNESGWHGSSVDAVQRERDRSK